MDTMPTTAPHILCLITFIWQGASLYSCHGTAIPRAGDFLILWRILHPRDGEVNTPTRWRVHAVEWTFDFEAGVGELRPEVDVHLRRVFAHEWHNRHEPTGMIFEETAGDAP